MCCIIDFGFRGNYGSKVKTITYWPKGTTRAPPGHHQANLTEIDIKYSSELIRKSRVIFLEPPDMPLAWCKRILLVSLVCQSNWSTNLQTVLAIPAFTEIDIKYSSEMIRKSRVIFLEPPDMPLAWCKRILLVSLVCIRYMGLYNTYFPLAIRWAESPSLDCRRRIAIPRAVSVRRSRAHIFFDPLAWIWQGDNGCFSIPSHDKVTGVYI